MATYPKILSTNEINEFDNPPVFNGYDRKVFFHLPTWANEFIDELSNDTNKLVFILMTGYFKCCRKFFVPGKFPVKDIDFIIAKFNLSPDTKKLQSFSRVNFLRYKEHILKNNNISLFDDKAKELITKEAKTIVHKKFKMKAIFHGLLEFLYLKRIEIPSYNALAQIITEVLNDYENSLQENISKFLDKGKRKLLDELMIKIESESTKKTKLGKYKLTKLKKFSHSIKPAKIKENIQSLRFFKNIFDNLQGVITAINLSNETIEYYATWSIKADSDLYPRNRT